jgi:hypothetical protein
MKKLSKWLSEVDMIKKMFLIFWFFFLMSGYWIYSAWDNFVTGSWDILSTGINIGLFLTSALYYSVILFWMKENKRRMTQITELIIENHALKHEILILSIPHIDNDEKVLYVSKLD